MSRPARWKSTVDAACAEACLAVRLYNDPAEPRSFESFIVHMHLAWLYLLQAQFQRDGVDYRYRKKDNPRLLEKVDGEPKRWELAKCVQLHWPEQTAVRANIEFFIALRNKIEHRFTKWSGSLVRRGSCGLDGLFVLIESFEVPVEVGGGVFPFERDGGRVVPVFECE